MEFGYFYGKQSSQHAFYRIPKQLFTDRQFDAVSVEAKLLYGIDDRPHGAVTEERLD